MTALLVLAPLSISWAVGQPVSFFSLPMVHSGDEPHYLVLIYSVIQDGDVDVANNYTDVHRGGRQAGRKFAGWAIDHHVNWYDNGELVRWVQAFNLYPDWDQDAEGHPVPRLRADSEFRPVSPREYSQHPPGLAWVLAPVAWPFRNTILVESVVLLCSSLVTIATMIAMYYLCLTCGATTRVAVLTAVIAVLASPVWHYGRTLYVEPYMMACAVWAYACALRFQRMTLAGILLGIATLMKLPFLVVALPLLADAAFHRRWIDILKLSIPIGIAVALQLICNQLTYGDPLQFSQKWEWGYPLIGFCGLALSWKHGLLLFSPIIALSLALGTSHWYRQRPREAIVIGAATVLYVAVISSWAQWWGGSCYSARLIMPVVPFMFLPLAALFSSTQWKSEHSLRAVTWLLVVVSMTFGAVGAFACENVWDTHPLQIIFHR